MKTHNSPVPFAPASLALAETRLREAGLRVTSWRVKVLAALLEANAARLHPELQAALPGIDRVTLYRSLDSLIDAGLAHKIATADRGFRYCAGTAADLATAQHHQHSHFKCTGCGKVFCLSSPSQEKALLDQLKKSLRQAVGPGFQTHDVELTVTGRCAHCAR